MKTIAFALSLVSAVLLAPHPAAAFDKGDPGAKSCAACHTLSRDEAASLLKEIADNVVRVLPGPSLGIWEVDASIRGKVYPLYVDYSKKLLVQGQYLRLSDRENLTRLRFEELNRIDVSSIPLKDAVVLGKASSKRRIIVFTDPSCPYCVKLHAAIKEAVAKDPEAAFFILPYPRNPADKETYAKALAAVCDKSGKTLDDVFAGKPAPAPPCKSSAVDDTVRLAERLQIHGTPTLILPDGRVVSGYRNAEDLLSLIR